MELPPSELLRLLRFHVILVNKYYPNLIKKRLLCCTNWVTQVCCCQELYTTRRRCGTALKEHFSWIHGYELQLSTLPHYLHPPSPLPTSSFPYPFLCACSPCPALVRLPPFPFQQPSPLPLSLTFLPSFPSPYFSSPLPTRSLPLPSPSFPQAHTSLFVSGPQDVKESLWRSLTHLERKKWKNISPSLLAQCA